MYIYMHGGRRRKWAVNGLWLWTILARWEIPLTAIVIARASADINDTDYENIAATTNSNSDNSTANQPTKAMSVWCK